MTRSFPRIFIIVCSLREECSVRVGACGSRKSALSIRQSLSAHGYTHSREGPNSHWNADEAQRQGLWSGRVNPAMEKPICNSTKAVCRPCIEMDLKQREIEEIFARSSTVGRRLGYEPRVPALRDLDSCNLPRVRRVSPFESDEKASASGWQVGRGWSDVL